MAEVTLSEYCDEAKELIRADSYDQAIAMCRQILKHYPKYVMGYRLMGEACLEKGDYVEAANLFKRVLGADMEDVVVRVGLAIIFEEQGALDEAIWQMERAFELGPGNAEIRAELQRLYADRDGTIPPKLKLTPAALGRLYLREELYQRAIDEFRSVLEEDPNRPDIQVALAQALWWSDQRQEAAEVCEALLEQYPHCLKANLILGEILLARDREPEARNLLDIAQALDPENVVAHALFRDKSSLAPQPVKVPRLDEAEFAEELEEFAPATPARHREDRPEPPAFATRPQEPLDEAMPEWLRRLREQEEEPEAGVPPASPGSHEMPDWLRQLAEERETEGAQSTEFEDRRQESEPGEMPAWLRDLRGETEEAAEEQLPLQVEPPAVEHIAPAAEETAGAIVEPAAWAEEIDQVSEAAEEPPSGLAESSEEPAYEQAAPGSDEAEEEIPDWLRDLRAEGVSGPVGAGEEIPAPGEPPTAEVSPESEEPETAAL
ncbi:MAG: tetratricopeptide repeat protein, partial [Anaerolineae bacterium]|nr:tetratricopeptide repeat protein [Anaerolineae bacterium]